MTETTDTKITRREGTNASEALSQLNIMCKTGVWVMKIMMVGLIFIAVAMPILFGATYVLDDPSGFSAPMTVDEVRATAVTMEVISIIAAAISYHIMRMCGNVRKFNTPFRDEIVKDLRTVALLLLLFTFAVPTVGASAAYLAGVTMDEAFSFNLFTLLVALLAHMLWLIFKYGTELQKESDETL